MAEGSLRDLGFFTASPISAGECFQMSESLHISAELRENTVSPERQEHRLWLGAEGWDLVCLSVLFPAAFGLHLSEMDDNHTFISCNQTLLRAEGSTADHSTSHRSSRSQHSSSRQGHTWFFSATQQHSLSCIFSVFLYGSFKEHKVAMRYV